MFGRQLLVVAMLAGAVGVAASLVYQNRVEEPVYRVESTHAGWEIRRYAPTIEARVTVSGAYDTAVRDGFRLLAAYIFGGNAPQTSIAMTAPVSARPAEGERIAMTAPVATTPAGDGAWVVSFTMPSSWSLDTLPAPSDPRVTLVAVDGARVAVRRFGGWATASRVARERAALSSALVAAGFGEGVPTVAQYNPPWTPPPLRRNEILVPLPAEG